MQIGHSPIADMRIGDTSCLQTRRSKILIMMLVNEIGLNWLHSVRGLQISTKMGQFDT